jgi:integrase
MSIYRSKNTPYYQFDFQFRGHRFHGTTKCKSRREAEAVERVEKDKAKKRIAETESASTSLLLDHVADRYWLEVGQHHAGADSTWRNLERLIDYFGATTLLTEITDDDVTKLVAWRRGHRVVRPRRLKKKDVSQEPMITNATVNRSTTGVLRKLFNRAKRYWNVRFDHEPNWRNHMLPEPEERIRELVGDEGERLELATRADHLPFFAFAKASGLRQKECILRWPEVDWQAGQIIKLGKGGKRIVVPITPTVRAILEPLQEHHPEFVFTYIARHTWKGRIKGRRYPLTSDYVKANWRRLRHRAGVTDFRFHDFRHDIATKILRRTGNLKLVQKALNHRDIKTTTRYAHVLTEEVAEALEQVAQDRRWGRNRLAESRNKSRTAPSKKC